MPKIISLSPAQAADYRARILYLYQESTGKSFELVTYLGAYEELQKILLTTIDIENGESVSLSPHRLRKLIYYTNPDIVPADKLESLSFGSDFIEVLERLPKVKSDEEVPKIVSDQPKRPVVLKKYILLVAVILLSSIGFILYRYFDKPYYFRDDFDKNSLEDLRKRGWDVLDFDSSLFYPQVDSELTLMTSRGDYWMRGNDTPMIKNVVYHKIPEMECAEITFKFKLLNCTLPHQQFALFLLDNELNRNNNIRIGVGGNKDEVYSDQIYNRLLAIIKNKNGEVSTEVLPFQLKADSNTIDTYINIIKYKKHLKFYFKKKWEYMPYDKSRIEFDLDYEPKYIALAAFNGYRNGDGLDAPLMHEEHGTVKIDWVWVEECK